MVMGSIPIEKMLVISIKNKFLDFLENRTTQKCSTVLRLAGKIYLVPTKIPIGTYNITIVHTTPLKAKFLSVFISPIQKHEYYIFISKQQNMFHLRND